MNQLSLLGPRPAGIKAGAFTPRPYQATADSAIDASLASGRSTLVCHPTGAGKTVLFCLQAVKRQSALVIVHRDTLMKQARDKLEAATGKTVEIEKGTSIAGESPYVVASVQSLHKERLARFKTRFPSFPLIIIDEAHRAVAKSYRAVVEAYSDAKILGVTATPDRSDGVAMKHMFETVAHEYSIIDATTDGWLTPLRFQPVHANINLDGVKLVGKGDDRDFDQAQLDSAVVQEASKIVESALRAMERSDNPVGRLIFFTPGVKTAHAGADAMNALIPGSAVVVDGDMDPVFQRRVIERFTSGEFRYIFNCNVLTEGFDDPTLYGIVDASPTQSRLRAMQRWGRATRVGHVNVDAIPDAADRREAIARSAKPWATVFDLAFNSSSHDVVSPIDILGGRDLPDAVKARAKQLLRERGGTAADAIGEAKDEDASKRKRAAAAKRLAAATEVTLGEVRSVFDRAGLKFIQRKTLPGKPADEISRAQWGLLKHRGIPIPEGCTIPMFKRLLNLDKKQEAKGYCRLGGVEWLRKFGVNAWKMPSATAIRIRDAIKANGHMSLTAEQMAPLMEARQPGED